MPKDKSISRRELLTITSVTAAYALMSKTALGTELRPDVRSGVRGSDGQCL